MRVGKPNFHPSESSKKKLSYINQVTIIEIPNLTFIQQLFVDWDEYIIKLYLLVKLVNKIIVIQINVKK